MFLVDTNIFYRVGSVSLILAQRDTVWEEVKHHRPEALKKPDVHFMRASQEYPEGDLLRTMCRVFSLDAGEIAALAVIEKNPEAMLRPDPP